MKLYSHQDLEIYVSPFFPWEKKENGLRIKTGDVFRPTHVTTRLCLELIIDLVRKIPHRSFLDIGCGSGIFALVAAKYGIPLVVGVDISFKAIQISRTNALENQLFQAVHWINGSSECISGRFDLIVANLPFTVLSRLLGNLAELLNLHGHLVASGFQDTEFRKILAFAKKAGLVFEKSLSADLTFFDIPPSGSFTWVAASFGKINDSCN